MTSLRRCLPAALALLLPLFAACRGSGAGDDDEQDVASEAGEDATTDPGTEVPPDADVPPDTDVSPDADVPPDADVAPDADVPPDADAGDEAETLPPCDCPPLPAACVPPPADVPSFTPDGDALERLFDLLACAERSIRLAIYEPGWDCVVDALLARLAADPDLTIDVLIDDDQCPRDGSGVLECALSRLEPHERAVVRDDARSRLMHHKFAVIDGARAWVSSANLTERSFCTDFNNALVVDEAAIVGAFDAEFTRLFVDGGVGPLPPGDPTAGGVYLLHLGPRSPTTSAPRWFTDLVAAVEGATTSVEVMINAWTRTEISDALVAAAGRGVSVRALVHHTYADDPPAQALVAARIPVRGDTIHSKVMVIDGRRVATGSANWSANAWENNEASLWVDDPGVGAAYRAEFDRVFAAAGVVVAETP